MQLKHVLFPLFLAVALPLPLLAQDIPMPQPVPTETVMLSRVTYDGVQFSFNAALADAVLVAQYSAQTNDGPTPSPAYTEFTFENYSEGDYLLRAIQPRVDIFRIEDFGAFPFYVEQLDALGQLLAIRPDLNQYTNVSPGTSDALTLPFLPVFPAMQVLRALPEYVEVGNVRGIRYLVYFSQAPNPVLEGEMFYTFQGITNDGQHYVSVLLPVNTGVLPTEEPAAVDMEVWMAGYQDYLRNLLGQVVASGGASATPSLATLDALAQSVTVSR